MRTIFHLDLDTFFFPLNVCLIPSMLVGKHIIVGANPKSGIGVIFACSYEARKFGLHSAMPILPKRTVFVRKEFICEVH